MTRENLQILKIHKLTQEQYDREKEANRLDSNALYLTPDRSAIIVDDTLSIPGAAADAKAVRDAISIKTYTSADQIGCTYGSSLEEIYNALPNNSIFMCGAENFTDSSWNLPNTLGTILVFKQAPARNVFLFFGKNPDIGDFRMFFDRNNKPTGEWVCYLSSILNKNLYGDKLPGEDGEPYTHVEGRIFFKKVTE